MDNETPNASPKDGSGAMKKPGLVLLILLVSLTLSGCRHVSRQDNPDWPSPGPVDLASLPAIGDVINHGTADPDKFLSQKPRPAATASPQVPASGPKAAGTSQPIMLGSLKEQPEQKPAAETSVAAAESKAGSSLPPIDSPPPAPAVNEPPAAPAESLPPPPPISTNPPPTASPEIPASAGLPSPTSPTLNDHPSQLQSSAANGLQSSVGSDSPGNSSVDAQVSRTGSDVAKPASTPPGMPADSAQFGLGFDGLPATAVSAGRVAARVGKEVITVYDLNMAIQDWIKANVPQGQTIPERERIMMARMVLFQMIDRMLIVQEANRMMKSEKQKEALLKQIDSVWEEQQIPPMMKKYKVETKYDLDQVLRKQGRSIDAARKDFINDALAHEFMGMKLGTKTYVSLTEMRRYYNDHLESFNQPAQLVWREIRIPIEKGRESDADAKIVKLIDELKQHSDFATLARRESKGPTADQGGLWETSPGSFAVSEVNTSLEKMQPGQVLGPIKAPPNYHILKMESRRQAGPARFDEVQTQIQEKLRQEKLGAASMGFIQDLRKKTIIWTIFDTVQAANPGDNQVKQAQLQPQPSGGSSPQASASASPQAMPGAAAQSSQLPSGPGTDTKALKFGAGGSQSQHDLHNRQISDTDPPPAIAPSGPIPPRGVMSGPSQPSPL